MLLDPPPFGPNWSRDFIRTENLRSFRGFYGHTKKYHFPFPQKNPGIMDIYALCNEWIPLHLTILWINKYFYVFGSLYSKRTVDANKIYDEIMFNDGIIKLFSNLLKIGSIHRWNPFMLNELKEIKLNCVNVPARLLDNTVKCILLNRLVMSAFIN